MFKVTISNQTVKQLKGELRKAYDRGDLLARQMILTGHPFSL